MKKNTVEELVRKNLCYQCGTCESICPTNAIKMEYNQSKGLTYPKINKEKCINCSKCLKFCTINNIDLNEKHLPNKEDFIGIYKSLDKERVEYTASGGLVTELIKYLLEKKIVNKAIVVGMNKDTPTFGDVFIVDDIDKLEEISGSVYQPVPVNKILKSIKENDKVIFIGLPCHIRGLEMFLKANPKLDETIIFKIGLICTIGRGKHGTDITIKRNFKIENFKEIKFFRYRQGIPPGNTIIKLKSKKVITKSCMKIYHNTDYIFIPKGCLFCNDLFNDKADITVGDPWGLNKGKKAMAIIRSKEIKEIISLMTKEKYLEFDEEIDYTSCIKTQKHCVNYKIYNYNARMKTYRRMHISMPNFKLDKNINDQRTIDEEIAYGLLALNSLFFNTKLGYKIASYFPQKIIYFYRDWVSKLNCKYNEGKNEK